MIEYGIEVIHGTGMPYMVNSYNNISDCIIALENMLSLYDNKRKFYYVDNDFFNNKYPYTLNGDYYCIKQRNISKWLKYEMNTIRKNNILYF